MITVTIDALVLHGIAPAERAQVAEGLQAELRRLFADHPAGGIPAMHAPRLKTLPIRAQASGTALGHTAAASVFKAIVR